MGFEKDKDVWPSTCNMVSIFAVCFLPSWIVVIAFSRMGAGMDLYNALADESLSLMGDGCVLLAAFFVTCLYIVDWSTFGMPMKVTSSLLPLSFLALGCLLKARKYPWGPMLMVLFMMPLSISAIRFGFCRNMDRSAFYKLVAKFCAACTTLILIAWVAWMMVDEWQWNSATKARLIHDSAELYNATVISVGDSVSMRLNYSFHCHPDSQSLPGISDLRNFTLYSDDEQLEISSGCMAVGTVWFMVWACPFICIAFQGALGLFCLLQGTLLVVTEADGIGKVERTLKRFALFLVICLGGIYGSSAISGASLRLGSMLMAFFVTAVVFMTIFTVLENPELIKVAEQQAQESKLLSLMRKCWQSDWAKAFFVGGVGVFVPPYLLVNWIKTKYLVSCRPNHKCAVESKAANSPFSGLAKTVYDTMSHWYWMGILHKVNLIGEVYFTFQVGVAKVTYVFLSWLNWDFFTDEWPIPAIIAVIYVIGFIMFMLPPVPGIPVYIFCGVVIAKPRPSMNYPLSIVIAISVAFSLKILASCGQYALGAMMGRSVKVQQLIGVDKVLTRALEKILKLPGLSIPKVAVLVGGPDWPTSVTCGILRLNVCQMVIGTCPVIIPMIPSVLAGAFLARAGEDEIWNMLSTTATSATVVFQAIPQALALYYLVTTVEKYQVELEQPREEHRQVEALTRSEMEFEATYRQVTEWRAMGPFLQGVLLSGTCLNLMSGILFTFAGELCFRSFAVSSRINFPHSEGGLNGDALSVILPFGRVPLGMFALCAILHYVFLKLVGCRAASAYKNHPAGAGAVPPTNIGSMEGTTEQL